MAAALAAGLVCVPQHADPAEAAAVRAGLGVQQGAAQKLPVLGHSEPAGAARMQAAPAAKPWHSASLVQLLGEPGWITP